MSIFQFIRCIVSLYFILMVYGSVIAQNSNPKKTYCNISGGISLFQSKSFFGEFGEEYFPKLNYNFQIAFERNIGEDKDLLLYGFNVKGFNYISSEGVAMVSNSTTGVPFRIGTSYFDYRKKFMFLNLGYGRSIEFNKNVKIIPKAILYFGGLEGFRKDEIIKRDSDGSTETNVKNKDSYFIFLPGVFIGADISYHIKNENYFSLGLNYDIWINSMEIPKYAGFFNFSLGFKFLIVKQNQP